MVVGVVALTGAGGCRSSPRQVTGSRLTNVGGYIEFVARQREQEQQSKVGSSNTKTEETILEENLRLEADGYVYHPNLLDFSLGGLFGLVQESFDDIINGQHRNSSDDGTVLEFDLDAKFLKRKKYPGSVFAHRHRGINPRPFLPSLETTTTNYGVIWQYVSEKTPTRFHFTHSEVLNDPLFVGKEEGEEGRQENTTLRFETGYNFSEHNTLSLLYQRESVEEEPFELDYDSDEVTLEHLWEFGEGHRHRLESELNYLDQRGTYNIERARWREILRLQHTDDLRSQYRLEVLDRTRGPRSADIPPIDERSIRFSGLLEHQLYDSLTSQIAGYVSRQKFEPGLKIDQIGTQLNLDYRKTNPWGVLHANYGARLERDDQRGEAQSAEVVEEPHTFRDPQPITLSNPTIDTGSIVIRSEDRVTFYQLGRDFTVREVGDQIEIDRVPTGRIADGETVLVDYVYALGGTYKLDTVGQTLGVRQVFEFGLTPYYRFEWQDQTISPAGATGATPNDITAHILGVEFEKASFRLYVEYEDRDSTIDPFEAVRTGASYTHNFKFGATANAAVHWTNIDHGPPLEREVELLTIDGRYRHPITSNFLVEGAVLYRDGEDSISGESDGVDFTLSLEWFIRKIEVRVTYEYGQFEDDFARNDSSMLYVQVRRTF